MPSLLHLATKGVAYIIFSGVILAVLGGGYGVARLLRIPIDWATWAVGSLFVLLSAVTAFFLFLPEQSTPSNGEGHALLIGQNNNILGNFALVLGFCAFGQWTTMRGYQLAKPRLQAFLAKQVRLFLTFIRKYHQLFGWLVLITATAHAVSYIYRLDKYSTRTLVAGIVTWLLLVGLAGLGLWMDYTARKKITFKSQRWVHFVTALLFFVALIVHS
jgi:hypothetical protein